MLLFTLSNLIAHVQWLPIGHVQTGATAGVVVLDPGHLP
jgi:hypothetical protein